VSDVLMTALQMKIESLTRQVETLAPENRRVRKLLTEFDQRHDTDKARIGSLETALRDVIGMLDDPTGAEHIRDMRGATVIARAALEP
jgi:hypothetical protein